MRELEQQHLSSEDEEALQRRVDALVERHGEAAGIEEFKATLMTELEHGDAGSVPEALRLWTVVTRAELDAIRRELAEVLAENAHLQAVKDEEHSHRPGPVATKVLAACLMVGGFFMLIDGYQGVTVYVPFPVWLAVTAGFGRVATLILDHSGPFLARAKSPTDDSIRRIGIGMGVVFLLVSAMAVLDAALGEAKSRTGGDFWMLILSFIVGTVVALSLRAMGLPSWRLPSLAMGLPSWRHPYLRWDEERSQFRWRVPRGFWLVLLAVAVIWWLFFRDVKVIFVKGS